MVREVERREGKGISKLTTFLQSRDIYPPKILLSLCFHSRHVAFWLISIPGVFFGTFSFLCRKPFSSLSLHHFACFTGEGGGGGCLNGSENFKSK